MKCSIILLVFFIIFCESYDFKCGCWDEMGSVEFYSASFEGNLPVNCSPSFSPTNIDQLKVKTLKIVGYKSTETNDFIQNYPNLNSLDISYSKHDENTSSLQKTWLNHNKLAILKISHSQVYHDGIHNLPNLTEIDLSNNNLSGLSKYVSIKLEKLLKLNLSHNKLEEINFSLFRDIPNSIESIDLSYNSIKIINYELFIRVCSSLKSLHLENNPIQNFDCEILLCVKAFQCI